MPNMKKLEKDLLMSIAEEVMLQLRIKLRDIEELHPSESAFSIATFRERLLQMEDLVQKIKMEREEG